MLVWLIRLTQASAILYMVDLMGLPEAQLAKSAPAASDSSPPSQQHAASYRRTAPDAVEMERDHQSWGPATAACGLTESEVEERLVVRPPFVSDWFIFVFVLLHACLSPHSSTPDCRRRFVRMWLPFAIVVLRGWRA